MLRLTRADQIDRKEQKRQILIELLIWCCKIGAAEEAVLRTLDESVLRAGVRALPEERRGKLLRFAEVQSRVRLDVGEMGGREEALVGMTREVTIS